MPHDPKVLLQDVRHAAQLIQEFTAGRTVADYGSNAMLRAAVERQFMIVGEALSRLDKLDATIAAAITDYRKIIGFRNVLVHGYETIDDQIVWLTIQQHLPVLQQEVVNLIARMP